MQVCHRLVWQSITKLMTGKGYPHVVFNNGTTTNTPVITWSQFVKCASSTFVLNSMTMVFDNQLCDWLFISKLFGYFRSWRILARLILPPTCEMLWSSMNLSKWYGEVVYFVERIRWLVTFPFTLSPSIAEQRSYWSLHDSTTCGLRFLL